MAAPSSDPSFVGIDPNATGTLISTITGKVSPAQTVAERYQAQFSQLGLSTGPIGTLLSDYSWVTGAEGVAMLKRRQGLAEHQPSGDFLKGTDWTATGAGKLTYKTDAEAATAGKKEGQNLLAALRDGDTSQVQAALKQLKGNSNDTAYTAALFTALGPEGMRLLAPSAVGTSSSAKSVAATVGTALTTASYGMTKAQATTFVDDIMGGPEVGQPSVAEDASTLMPFLSAGGKFSDQFLSPLAQYAMGDAGSSAGTPEQATAIWGAISRNAPFAAQLFHQNTGRLQELMTGPDGPVIDNSGFSQFLIAATNAPKGDTSPLYTQNFKDFVGMFDTKVVPTTGSVRQAMAVDSMTHFNDLKAAVTAAAPGAVSPLGLSSDQWGMFVQNAMKDPSAAAYIIANYTSWENAQPLDSIAQHGAGDNSDTPGKAGFWNDGELGILNYFFESRYNAAGTTAGTTNNSLESALEVAASVLGPAVATTLTLGPEAGIGAFVWRTVDTVADPAAATIVGTQFTSTALQLIVAQSVKYGFIQGTRGLTTTPGTSPGKLAGSLVNLQANWSSLANKTWQQTGSKPGQPDFLSGPGVQTDSKTGLKYIKYNGKSYTGDPLPYEKQYGASFVNANGSIKSNLKGKALAAYNAWLQDPAVSYQTAEAFKSETANSVLEYVQQQLGNPTAPSSGGGAAGSG